MASLVIGIRYLTGYAVATDPAARDRPEWPPHPARVFMALAAAYFETDGSAAEEKALRWLESQPSPVLRASDADERRTAESYVPVNDDAVGKKPGPVQSIQGWRRTKQPRTWPSVRPRADTVLLVWPDVEPNGHHPALRSLCRKVTRIGHSSSLVQVWAKDTAPGGAPEDRWEPDDLEADMRLRVPSKGLLERLVADHERGQRPHVGTWQGYRRVTDGSEASPACTVWSHRLVVGRLVPVESVYSRLELVATLQVTERLHQAVLSQTREPVPEFISGHQRDGSPSEIPHLAYLPLAFVGSEHATGHLMGVAVAVPRELDRAQRLKALAAVGRLEQEGLALGALGKWALARDDLGQINLRADVWTGHPQGRRRWATVTPIAFDRHAKSKDRAIREQEQAEMIRQCCTRIGLPEPVEVGITPVSAHQGAPPAHEFPRLRRKDGSQRRHAHALLLFDEPVCGPIALGAGRYRAYGFCRPLREQEGIR
jgi:CRISPR-associated protein Csb2